MKKTFVTILLLIFLCGLLLGCTPDSEKQQTEPNVSLPTLQTEAEQAASNSNQSDAEKAASDSRPADAATDLPVPETTGSPSDNANTPETETEFVSEFVVDGVGSFGEGGN